MVIKQTCRRLLCNTQEAFAGSDLLAYKLSILGESHVDYER